jgi:chemotaxis protein CheX
MGAPAIPARRSVEEDEDQTRCIAHLDDAVGEVFELMLRQRCALIDESPAAAMSISAKIVFSGTLEGQCMIQVSAVGADRLADALLGSEGDWDEVMIDDAVGELCNMIAGGWKSRLGAPASVCHLSMPAVSRGLASGWPDDATTATRRFYEFNGTVLEVTLALR